MIALLADAGANAPASRRPGHERAGVPPTRPVIGAGCPEGRPRTGGMRRRAAAPATTRPRGFELLAGFARAGICRRRWRGQPKTALRHAVKTPWLFSQVTTPSPLASIAA